MNQNNTSPLSSAGKWSSLFQDDPILLLEHIKQIIDKRNAMLQDFLKDSSVQVANFVSSPLPEQKALTGAGLEQMASGAKNPPNRKRMVRTPKAKSEPTKRAKKVVGPQHTTIIEASTTLAEVGPAQPHRAP